MIFSNDCLEYLVSLMSPFTPSSYTLSTSSSLGFHEFLVEEFDGDFWFMTDFSKVSYSYLISGYESLHFFQMLNHETSFLIAVQGINHRLYESSKIKRHFITIFFHFSGSIIWIFSMYVGYLVSVLDHSNSAGYRFHIMEYALKQIIFWFVTSKVFTTIALEKFTEST